MDLSKIISFFNSSTKVSVRKEDITDPNLKNDTVVKAVANIFDTNLDGIVDTQELSLFDKVAKLDNNNDGISTTDFKLFGALSGSATNITSNDFGVLNITRYKTGTDETNNQVSTFDSLERRNSSTVVNNDGSVTTKSYLYDKTEITTDYTKDYIIKTKTISHSNGTEEKFSYNDAGILVKKEEISLEGNKTISTYNNEGKVSSVIKKDSNNNFISRAEYDYDDNGQEISVIHYSSEAPDAKKIAQTVYNEERSRVQVKYDENEEIIQRDILNKNSKPYYSFVKNPDGTTVTANYEYGSNGNHKVTTITTNLDGTQTEQLSINYRNGNKEFFTNGILVRKDEVVDNNIKSTAYSADNVIDTITVKDKKGNILNIDTYSYLNGNIDTVVRKDAQGSPILTDKYNYDANSNLSTVDRFDSAGNLSGKITYNPDGTKIKQKFSNNIATLTENYGADNRIINSVEITNDGYTLTSVYTFDSPNSGDISINIEKTKDSVVNLISEIRQKDGSKIIETYNSDGTQLLQRESIDKKGNKTLTSYDNNQITSILTSNTAGKVVSKDIYNYTDGILSSIQRYDQYNKLDKTTEYDQYGNSREIDYWGRVIASKTTDPTTGAVTTESCKYSSINGDKMITTTTVLNNQLQSIKTEIIHSDNSSEASYYIGDSKTLVQKDVISKNGDTKSTVYNPETKKVSQVINISNVGKKVTNLYNYSTTGLLSYIDGFDNEDNLIQRTEYGSDGQKIITSYDIYGNIKGITTYDKDGNVIL